MSGAGQAADIETIIHQSSPYPLMLSALLACLGHRFPEWKVPDRLHALSPHP